MNFNDVWRLPGSTNPSTNDDHSSCLIDTEVEEIQTMSVQSVFEIEDNSSNVVYN